MVPPRAVGGLRSWTLKAKQRLEELQKMQQKLQSVRGLCDSGEHVIRAQSPTRGLSFLSGLPHTFTARSNGTKKVGLARRVVR